MHSPSLSPIKVNLNKDNRTTESYISTKQIIMKELHKTALRHTGGLKCTYVRGNGMFSFRESLTEVG